MNATPMPPCLAWIVLETAVISADRLWIPNKSTKSQQNQINQFTITSWKIRSSCYVSKLIEVYDCHIDWSRLNNKVRTLVKLSITPSMSLKNKREKRALSTKTNNLFILVLFGWNVFSWESHPVQRCSTAAWNLNLLDRGCSMTVWCLPGCGSRSHRWVLASFSALVEGAGCSMVPGDAGCHHVLFACQESQVDFMLFGLALDLLSFTEAKIEGLVLLEHVVLTVRLQRFS